MADKRNYNANLNARGLEKDVTDDQARAMCGNQGGHYLFVIEAHVGPKTIAEDGAERVSLVIDGAELVPTEHEDRVRDFKRALYLDRPGQHGQAAFEGAVPGDVDVDTAAAGLEAGIQRDTTGDPMGTWDGDPDAPINTGQGIAAPDDPAVCDFPGCFARGEHDVHEDSEGNPLATEG